MAVWIVIGASRGIGLEWVRQLLARGDHVYATVRDPAKASQLWTLAGSAPRANCQLLLCDVSSEASIVASDGSTHCVWVILIVVRASLKKSRPRGTLIGLTMSLLMQEFLTILM